MSSHRPAAPTISVRKQVCRACRSRKKRCDAVRPTCSSCRQWNLTCEYVPASSFRPSQRSANKTYPTLGYEYAAPLAPPDQVPEFPLFGPLTPSPTLRTEPDPFHIEPQTSLPWEELSFQWSLPNLFPPQSPSLPSEPPQLPNLSILLELVQNFFSHFHFFLPSFDRASFIERVMNQSLQEQVPVLLYAVISMAASLHPDAEIQACQQPWFERAKSLYKSVDFNPDEGVDVVLAACCLVLQAFAVGEYTTGWLILGTAWRQACSIGLNRIDSNPEGIPGISTPARNLQEKETRRRVMWTLFILDRGMSFPAGRPHAIDDRYFVINLPSYFGIDEGTSGALSLELAPSIPFDRRLGKLVVTEPGLPLKPFHSLLKAYVILGRITEHVHVSSIDPEFRSKEFHELDSHLVHFRLSLPRPATSVFSAPTTDQPIVVWLAATLNVMTILLHHRAQPQYHACNDPSPLFSSYESSTDDGFSKCVAAARQMMQLVKDASRISTDLLVNPHIAPMLYLAGRILLVDSVFSCDESVRADMDLLLLVFQRLAETFKALGRKFERGIRHDLELDAENALKIKAAGSIGVMTEASQWCLDFMKESDIGRTR